jgi:hypothetical protein
MTLIEMAKQAGFGTGPYGIGVPPNRISINDTTDAPWMLEAMEKLETLIRADQKEIDAKICEESLDGTNADQWVVGDEFQFAAMRIRTQKEK